MTFTNDTLVYSRSLDHYPYRVLKRVNKYNDEGLKIGQTWIEGPKSPTIDRIKDRMYLCVGLELIDMGGLEPYIVTVSIRSKTSTKANLTLDFYSYSAA